MVTGRLPAEISVLASRSGESWQRVAGPDPLPSSGVITISPTVETRYIRLQIGQTHSHHCSQHFNSLLMTVGECGWSR